MASSATRLRIDPQRSRVSRCTSRKTGFETRLEAVDAADVMMFEGLVLPGCHITPYHCAECDQWHVYNRIIVPMER